MRYEVLNPRRAPRVPGRYSVELRHRFSAWVAETEDLGPAGCQIVTSRLLSRGRDVRVKLRVEDLGREVKLDGRVVWTRPESPARIGVVFTPVEGEPDWFGELVAADPVAARIVARTPERIASTARLFLGVPPIHVADFTADELAVLRAAASGFTVDALSRALGDGFERTRGAVFSLVSRRLVVLDPTGSVPAHRWRHVIGDVAGARGERAYCDRSGANDQPRAAQALYDEGIAHLNAGRLGLAVQRLREALDSEPGDELPRSAMHRSGPFAG